MTDDATPKRVRGQKDREAAFKAGFVEGVLYGASEAERKQEVYRERDGALEASLAKYRRTMTTEPKRRRRKDRNEKRLDHIAAQRDAALDAS